MPLKQLSYLRGVSQWGFSQLQDTQETDRETAWHEQELQGCGHIWGKIRRQKAHH